jgi:hypothetical protein
MKITNKEIKHSCIGLDYETIEVKWWICCEESDFNDPKMFLKFNYCEINQCQYKDELLTWFKGSRTNTFNPNVKDQMKQKFIEIVNKFLLENDQPLELSYTPTK